MFTFHMPDAGAAPELIIVFEQDVVGETINVPAHSANDMIVLFSRSVSATIPGLVAGWTSILTQVPTFGNAYRIMYFVDVPGTLTTIVVPSGAVQTGVIYRNASGIGNITNGVETGPSTTRLLSTVGLANTLGPSRVYAGYSDNQGYSDVSDPADHTRLWDSRIPVIGGGGHAGWDIVPNTSTYSGGTISGQTNGFYAAFTLEILAD